MFVHHVAPQSQTAGNQGGLNNKKLAALWFGLKSLLLSKLSMADYPECVSCKVIIVNEN